MKKTTFLFAIPLFLYFTGTAQDSLYTRFIIHKLTSPEFFGRGYVHDGCHKAAVFLSHQFDSLGLKSFGENYFQPFSFPVNTFPSEMEVSVDGKKLFPGKDFQVNPHTPAIRKTYWLEPLENYRSPDIFNQKPSTCFYTREGSLPDEERARLFQDLDSGKIRAGAYLMLVPKKLTWSVARSQFPVPVLQIIDTGFDAKAKKISIRVDAKFFPDYPVQNVVGFVKGKLQPDSFLVISAHYDHLGKMGNDTYFPGANDNASGVSMLLRLASHYSRHPAECSIVFIAFAGEEAGLMGSKYFTENPLFPLPQIKFLINLDLLGTGEEGMMAVNATEFPAAFAKLDSLNNEHKYLSRLAQRGKAKNSDHYWFTEKGVPAFFFYTMGGIQAYHDIYDRAETLPLTEYEDVIRLILQFSMELQER